MKLLADGAREIGLDLTSEHLSAFQIYYEELVAWNKRFNLTAITDYEGVQVKHFLDSLSCLLANEVREKFASSSLAIDVGSGAGFPGLPLRIACPKIRITLLESTGKKVTFLEHIVKKLSLTGVEVIKGRAEELGHDPIHRERYEIAFARAVAELSVLVEYTLPFLEPGGLLVAQKGADVDGEVKAAEGAIAILGGNLLRILPVEIKGLEGARSLVLIEKTKPTPEKYPRRPGIPAKRPLKLPACSPAQSGVK
jgi:16S rRNA (guanine527-N7)-methyltransferase